MLNSNQNKKEEMENKALIQYVIDQSVKERYEKLFPKEKFSEIPGNQPRFSPIWLVKMAAALTLIIVATFLIVKNINENSLNNMADRYLASTIILSDQNVMRKDVATHSEILIEATKYFTERQYDKAIESYQKISVDSNFTATDEFYLAVSYVKSNKKYEKLALNLFDHIENSSSFVLEINWFKAICYLKLGQNQKAKLQLQKVVEAGDYKKSEAMKLLEKLD